MSFSPAHYVLFGKDRLHKLCNQTTFHNPWILFRKLRMLQQTAGLCSLFWNRKCLLINHYCTKQPEELLVIKNSQSRARFQAPSHHERTKMAPRHKKFDDSSDSFWSRSPLSVVLRSKRISYPIDCSLFIDDKSFYKLLQAPFIRVTHQCITRFANQPLSILGESNDRQSGYVSLVIRDDLKERTKLLVFKEHANVFFFLYSSFEQVYNCV
jgi:hypothetical protein